MKVKVSIPGLEHYEGPFEWDTETGLKPPCPLNDERSAKHGFVLTGILRDFAKTPLKATQGVVSCAKKGCPAAVHYSIEETE